MHSFLKRSLIAVTLGAFVLGGMPAVSYAGMIATVDAIRATSPSGRAANLTRIEAGLNRADVRAELVRLGVDPADATARAQALDDQQLARLADRMDTLPAGGDGGILAVIGIVFIVLLILDYVGVINVFKLHHK